MKKVYRESCEELGGGEFDEAKRLLDENEKLRAERDKLQAQIDDMRKAGDEMAQALFNATRVFEFRRLPAPLYTAEVENCLSVEHALQQHCEITWGHRVTCKCNWQGAEPPRDKFWCPECKYSVEPLFAKMINPKE